MMQYNSNQIAAILPHRYPFALVDRIVDGEEGKWAKGIKCVSANEPFFQGHFPQYHVMPGVLIIEALAQVGSVAMLSVDAYKGKTGYFGGINNCKFKHMVRPGDKLRLECEIIKQKGPVGVGKATATVDGKLAATAELTFMIG